jgi:hypothetical protein
MVFPLSVLMVSEACLSSDQDSEDDAMPQLVNDSSSSPSVVEVEVEVEADDGSPMVEVEVEVEAEPVDDDDGTPMDVTHAPMLASGSEAGSSEPDWEGWQYGADLAEDSAGSVAASEILGPYYPNAMANTPLSSSEISALLYPWAAALQADEDPYELYGAGQQELTQASNRAHIESQMLQAAIQSEAEGEVRV